MTDVNNQELNKEIIVVGAAGRMGGAFAEYAKKNGYYVNGFDPKYTASAGQEQSIKYLENALYVERDSYDSACQNRYAAIVDFSSEDAFMENINLYAKFKKQVVVGTTGWFKKKEKLEQVVKTVNDAGVGLIYAGNFSIGTQAAYSILEVAAKLVNAVGGFDVQILEEHHKDKVDNPSGTANEMANVIMGGMTSKTEVLEGNTNGKDKIKPCQIQIVSGRFGSVFGKHTITFDDGMQRIIIIHESLGRTHFAAGAGEAVEFIRGKSGIFTMKDLVKEKFAGIVKG
ncbi:MAG: 4-hydroxy-tetrahydrodipicolinate reductase [Alphaproteobacteria bacterium]|nr:4-hydroxy-tetrahydrodipicolinate reductase [Alphaproteobacteria bacterium]